MLYRVAEKIHLVYSARRVPVADESSHQFTGLMKSEDGIHFTRPSLELFPPRGFQQTNIIWQGRGSHSFAPFAGPLPPEAQSACRHRLALAAHFCTRSW